MGRRGSGGGEPVRTQRRKAATLKRRNGPKAVSRRSPTAGRETRVAKLSRELNEALEQQAAMSEVLQIIGSSQGRVAPVFDALLANATRLCEANFGMLWMCEGNGFRCAAGYNLPPAYTDVPRYEPVAHPGTARARVAKTRQVVHIADVRMEEAYADRDPARVRTVEVLDARTLIA